MKSFVKELGLDRFSTTVAKADVDDGPAPEGATRREFIGGSEVAAVLGLSPWDTALDVYFRKTGEGPKRPEIDPALAKVFRRGKRAEPHAIAMAVEDLGLTITKVSLPDAKNYYRDAEYPFLAAEIDFEWEVTPDAARLYDLPEELIGTTQNGEIKTVSPFSAERFGEAETDEVPVQYAAQAMHGLSVSGRAVTLFLVLTGWDDLTVYFVRRDDETIAAMRSALVRFWTEHVVARVPPEPRNLPDVKNLLGRLGETKIEATAEVTEAVAELAKLRAEEKKIGERIEELQFVIGRAALGAERFENPEAPGSHVILRDGAPILTIAAESSYRLNEAKLRAKYPDVAADCVKVFNFFVFRTPRAKRGGKAA